MKNPAKLNVETQVALQEMIGNPKEGRFSDWLWEGVRCGLLHRQEAEDIYLAWLPLDRLVPVPLWERALDKPAVVG